MNGAMVPRYRSQYTALVRWTRAALLCVAAGALANAGLAWALAVRGSLGHEGEFIFEERPLYANEAALVRLFCAEGLVVGCVERIRPGDPESYEGGPRGWQERLVVKWANGLARQGTLESRFITASGWPALAFWCELDVENPVMVGSPRSGPFAIRSVGAFNIDSVPGPESFARFSEDGYACLALPCRPIWSGMALNTAVYSLTFLLLFASAASFRRAVRLRAGRCLRCGYDLIRTIGPLCPECGDARPGRKANPC